MRFWYPNSKFCTAVHIIRAMILIFGTKVVPVTALYHYTVVFPPMSVRVNYFQYTTVGTLVCIVVFMTAVLVYFRRCVLDNNNTVLPRTLLSLKSSSGEEKHARCTRQRETTRMSSPRQRVPRQGARQNEGEVKVATFRRFRV